MVNASLYAPSAAQFDDPGSDQLTIDMSFGVFDSGASSDADLLALDFTEVAP